VLVVLLLRNRETFVVPLVRGCEVPLVLSEPAQLPIADRRAVQVALLFFDGNGLEIPLPRAVEVLLLLATLPSW